MDFLKRLDRGWARFEGRITVGVLLMMVLVAGFQALVRNLTRFDIAWANEMLTDMDWADSMLRKGTMWLAFLGASLATYTQKHIGIDVILRIVPVRAKYIMRALSGMLSGLITLGLVYCFWQAVQLNLAERPLDYELLADSGSIHVCDASQAQLDALQGFERPDSFCVFRDALSLLGVGTETPGAAFQLIVPLMLLVMALRLLGSGLEAAHLLAAGPAALERADAEERAREKQGNERAATMAHGGEA